MKCKVLLSRVMAVAALAVGVCCATPARAVTNLFANVPEAAGYTLLYDLDIPATGNAFNAGMVPYSVNNSLAYTPGSFSRVGYYLELQGSSDATRPNGFVYVSFDAASFTTDPTKLGVPVVGTGIAFNGNVTNMNVVSNVPGITTGTNLAGGKLEFWPSNYAVGANGVFDHDDTGFNATVAGHGSMQIHNTAVPQTLIGFSDWGGNTPAAYVEIGIGNNPGVGDPDWTFSDSGSAYTVRNLAIVVDAAPPAPTALASPDALWKASEYTGGDWVDSINGIVATPRPGTGNPTANQVDGVFFDGIDDAFTVLQSASPVNGLNDFSVTVVFEADGALGEGGKTRSAGDTNAFWQVSHFVGTEQPGGGAGDWGIGMGADQNLIGGVGLQGDQTVPQVVGPFNDGQRHIVTMVMDSAAGQLRFFIDGNLVRQINVTPNTLIDGDFYFGSNGANNFTSLNDLAFYHGHLLEIAFHRFSLDNSEVFQIHSAGTADTSASAVPEPTTALLTLMGLAGLARRRRVRN